MPPLIRQRTLIPILVVMMLIPAGIYWWGTRDPNLAAFKKVRVGLEREAVLKTLLDLNYESATVGKTEIFVLRHKEGIEWQSLVIELRDGRVTEKRVEKK